MRTFNKITAHTCCTLLLLMLGLAVTRGNAQTERDIADIAKETVERLDRAVPKTDEELLKNELKAQLKTVIQLELENLSLKKQLDELQQDIVRIRSQQQDSGASGQQEKTIRLLMEKQNQINALIKQIEAARSGSVPVAVTAPAQEQVDSAHLKMLETQVKHLESTLSKKEEENYNLEKSFGRLRTYYENKFIRNLNADAVAATPVPSRKPTLGRASTGTSIFDETPAPASGNIPDPESVTEVQPTVKRPTSATLGASSNKFDALLEEKDPSPIPPIQPVENTTEQTKPPVASPAATENPAAPTAEDNTTPTRTPPPPDFSRLSSSPKDATSTPSTTPAATPTAVETPAAPTAEDNATPTRTPPPPDFSRLSSSPKDATSTPSTHPATPPAAAETPAAPTVEDNATPTRTSPPPDFSRLSSSPQPATAENTAGTEAPENPVIAQMFQDWTHESDYKSLLPKQKPKPATGIDLLGRRHSRLGIGLEHYDIPGQGMVETSPSTPEPETPKAEIPPRAKDDGLTQATTETGTEHSPESSETEPKPEPKPEAESPNNNALPAQPEKAAPTDKPDEPAEGILEIEASVDYLSGRSNVPAYHTEFFITTQDLNDILSGHPEIQEEFEKPGKNISSYAELWARAQKYGYNYPGLASKIRNALKDDGAHRIRTNAVGKAQIRLRGKEQLQGRRYIIGVSSLGTVGVVWSKEFLIQDYAGNNKLLTLDGKDAIWLQ